MRGQPVKIDMSDDSSSKNFPFKCFYNNDENMIYSFYRQGEFFNISVDNISKYDTGDCTDMSLGDMYLIYNQVLVARSSQEVVFFKLQRSENDPTLKWT